MLVVHEDADTRELALGALRAADHEAVAFVDPIVALDAIEADSRVRVLVTGATFPAGKPNGVSLGCMVRVKRPGVKIVFLAAREGGALSRGPRPRSYEPRRLFAARCALSSEALAQKDGA